MESKATPKAAQEHRCLPLDDDAITSNGITLECSCGEHVFSREKSTSAFVNAFTSHVLAASRGEAPFERLNRLGHPRELVDKVSDTLYERGLHSVTPSDAMAVIAEVREHLTGEAPAFSEAQRERAARALQDEYGSWFAGGEDDGTRQKPDSLQPWRVIVAIVLAALKETP